MSARRAGDLDHLLEKMSFSPQRAQSRQNLSGLKVSQAGP